MSRKEKKNFDDEFKIQVCRKVLAEDGNRSDRDMAKEFGISSATLSRWLYVYKKKGEKAFGKKKVIKSTDKLIAAAKKASDYPKLVQQEQKVAELQTQLVKITQERDALKKALRGLID